MQHSCALTISRIIGREPAKRNPPVKGGRESPDPERPDFMAIERGSQRKLFYDLPAANIAERVPGSHRGLMRHCLIFIQLAKFTAENPPKYAAIPISRAGTCFAAFIAK
jgi:hypothetical protein